MIYTVKDVVLSVVISLLLIAGGSFGLSFLVPIAREQVMSTWPPAVQNITILVGSAGLMAGALLVTVLIAGAVIGLADARKERHANHHFANESTPGRIVVARYSKAGDRDVILDVPTDGKRLWLAPSTDFDNLSIHPYIALLDHAPLYLRREDEDPASYKQPMLHPAHNTLWNGSATDRSKAGRAHREAIQQAIDAGMVTLHVGPGTWEPAVPADAKFRTRWNTTPLARAGAGVAA
ncbi:hypothetical protein ACWGJ9_09860 [Curtobacterium citreum]